MLTALGIDPNGTLPAWWQGWSAKTHVHRWIDDLGLFEDRIIETANETRRDHPAPPDGPKALDRAMERAAKRQSKLTEGARPSAYELATFHADMVNSERFLPANTNTNTLREAMLSLGLPRRNGRGRSMCIEPYKLLTIPP